MTANVLDLTYDEIQGYVGQSLMWDRNVGKWSSTETNDFDLSLKRGVRRVYFNAVLPGESQPHTWTFLRPSATLTASAPYSTGTIQELQDQEPDPGQILLTGGTWPSWAAQGTLWYTHRLTDEAVLQTIQTRLSTTLLLPTSDALGMPSDQQTGISYTLRQHTYNLPDDFAGMASNGFTLRRDQRYLGQIVLVNEQEIRRYDDDSVTGVPRIAALIPVAATDDQTTRWQVMFYPLPNVDYELDYRYSAVPPNITSNASYHWGGAPISELMLASILDYAWQIIRDSNEKHDDYLDCLRTAVLQDRKLHPTHTYGQGSRSLGAGARGYSDYLDAQRRNIPYGNITTNW